MRKEKRVKEKKRSESEQRKISGNEKKRKLLCKKNSELKSAFYTNKPMFVLLYKEMLFNINDLDSSLPNVVSSLFQEFKGVFPKDGFSGLLPKERKELQCHVEELISLCEVHVLLVPKKDGLWRIGIYFCVINNIMVKIRG